MFTSTFSYRVKAAIDSCVTLLENHYRDHQIFHDGCVCGRDGDEDDDPFDYDDNLCFMLEEAKLAQRLKHDWITEEGKFKRSEIQYEVAELFAYCQSLAESSSPLLGITLKCLIIEMDERLPVTRKRLRSGQAVSADDHLDRLLTNTLGN